MIGVIDIETTGFLDEDPTHEIVEVGVTYVHRNMPGQSGTVGETMSWLVKPTRPIPPMASAIHHITAKDVETLGIPLAEALGAIEPCEAYCAHNAKFERAFLKDKIWPRPWIDTYRVAVQRAPQAPGFGNQVLRYWLKLEVDHERANPPHRAGPDSYVTAHLLARMLARCSVDEMIDMAEGPLILPKFTFGKHAMQPIEDVPSSYLEWMLKQDEMDPDAKHTAYVHLLRRREQPQEGK